MPDKKTQAFKDYQRKLLEVYQVGDSLGMIDAKQEYDAIVAEIEAADNHQLLEDLIFAHLTPYLIEHDLPTDTNLGKDYFCQLKNSLVSQVLDKMRGPK